jgi:hypothetical protein
MGQPSLPTVGGSTHGLTLRRDAGVIASERMSGELPRVVCFVALLNLG